MALYAFDGTGQEDREDSGRDSNVVDFFSAYHDPQKNADPKKDVGSLYLKGIGRRRRDVHRTASRRSVRHRRPRAVRQANRRTGEPANESSMISLAGSPVRRLQSEPAGHRALHPRLAESVDGE